MPLLYILGWNAYLAKFTKQSSSLGYTCSVGMNLYKQSIFAQPATQEEGSDVMSCFFHSLENMKSTKLKPEKKTQGESGYR